MKTFDFPVVVTGAGMRGYGVASVEDAVDFLEEWPVYRRNVLYEAAKRLCHSAHDGFARPLPRAAPSPNGRSWRRSPAARPRRGCSGKARRRAALPPERSA
jgi:hypothetical protein